MPRPYVLRLAPHVPQCTVHLHPVGAEIVRTGKAPPVTRKRGHITDMSTKSRLRAAYDFSNAPRAWGVMVTLTFPSQPDEPKKHFRRWRDRMASILHDGVQWGWIMEFQGRGVIHFHVFIELPLLVRCGLLKPACIQRVSRHGRATDLVRGYLGDLARDSWLADLPGRNPGAEAFNEGGIVELLRTPDAAGRYIAKEAGKRAQKRLPEGVKACGRWYWLNPNFKPVASRKVEIPDVGLPPYRRVFDQDDIRSPLFRPVPVTSLADPHSASFIPQDL